MLRQVGSSPSKDFINFGAITPNSNGKGIAYCYNAVIKKTQAGKPFVTLHLRDTNGVTVPGYYFDLAQPLLAGKEVTAAIGMPLMIDWQENYLRNVGLTLLVDRASIVTDLSANELGLFTGSIEGLDKKMEELSAFFKKELNLNTAIPFWVTTYNSIDHCQGRVGGLCEHYWRIMNILKSMSYLDKRLYSKLVATFLIYIFVHANHTRLAEAGKADIAAVALLTDHVNKLNATLHLGPGVLELVHSFFGYKATDIYVRTVLSMAEQVCKVDKEFALYATIPVQQEGDAGYGKIRRYEVESPA